MPIRRSNIDLFAEVHAQIQTFFDPATHTPSEQTSGCIGQCIR